MKSTPQSLLFLALSASGCTSLNDGATQSQWSMLKTAERVECHAWPVLDGDLDVTKLNILRGDKLAFLSEGRSRTSRPVQYYTTFMGSSEIERDDLRALEWGEKASFLAGYSAGGRTLAFVMTSEDDESSTLEMRNLATNVVERKVTWSTGAIDQVDLVRAGDTGIWLSYKTPVEDEAIDDMPAQLAYAEWQPTGEDIKVSPISGLDIIGRTALIASGNPQTVLAVWLDIGTSTAIKAPTFRFLEIGKSGPIEEAHDLNLELGENIESWSAHRHGEKVYLAYVEGDSLLGNAALKVARISYKIGVPRVDWVKSKPLIDEHVADPVWVSHDDAIFTLLPKWLDGESTLAVYQVSDDGLAYRGAQGIFSEGTSLLDAFHTPESGESHILVRYGKRHLQEFALCDLNGL